MLLTTLTGMTNVSDSTESLLSRTKKLLQDRGELNLRQIADGAEVGYEWLRSFAYGERIKDPGITRLEKLHNFLAEYQAAKRFRKREEARAS